MFTALHTYISEYIQTPSLVSSTIQTPETARHWLELISQYGAVLIPVILVYVILYIHHQHKTCTSAVADLREELGSLRKEVEFLRLLSMR